MSGSIAERAPRHKLAEIRGCSREHDPNVTQVSERGVDARVRRRSMTDMITTYMSLNALTIISVSPDGVWVKVRRENDQAIREWRIADLRSDTIAELETALAAAPVI